MKPNFLWTMILDKDWSDENTYGSLNIIERDQYGGEGVLVLGSISFGGRTKPYVLLHGTQTVQRYTDILDLTHM